jgi:hypothetical protein
MRAKCVLTILALVFLTGCGSKEAGKKEIVAYVNREPVLASELNRAIALKVRQDPAFRVTPEARAEMLDIIINRKLIIQKAMEAGLARQDKFVNTIKSFWEQTLVRDFIEYKQKAFGDYTFATEGEIKSYYDNLVKDGATEPLDALRPEIEKRIAGDKEAKLFEDWLKDERAKARINPVRKDGSRYKETL